MRLRPDLSRFRPARWSKRGGDGSSARSAVLKSLEMFRFRRPTLRHNALAILAGCLVLCAPEAIGQEVPELSLKVAFIHNFLKFTHWPEDVLAPGAPLAACVLGDASLGDVLQNYAKGHPVDGHEIV